MKRLISGWLCVLMVLSLFSVWNMAAATIYEVESNDTRDTADTIYLDEEVQGRFHNSDDKDWYRITIPYSGKFKITWSSDYPVSVRLYRTLADGTVSFENDNSSGKIESMNSGNTVYYLRLSQRYNSSPSFAYSMKVSITDTSADFYEIESNDTRSSANVISLDENVAGMFNNSDDLDWYKITIPYSGKFTIAWSSNYPVSVRLYRTLADGTVPFENENSNGKIESINSGNTVYYLRLSQRYNSSPSFAYSMKVSITDTSADHYEIENNDKRENADRISLFEKVNGIFNNSDDLDWYRISIPINGKFTIAWSSNYPVLVKLYRTLADGTISFENENSNGKIESMNSGNTVYYLRLSQRYNSSPTFYYSFSVTSEIPTPDTFKASSTTTVNKLKWSKVNGATGYVLYRYNPSTKKYKKLTALGADTTSYKVTDLKPGREYTYAIRTYRKENGKNYFSEFKHLTTATKPLAPTVKTVSAKNHKIAMTWYKVSGASYYQVYMAVGSGKYKCVTTTDDLKFSKSGLTSGTTYSLRVRACKVFDGGVVYSAFSDVRTVTMP